MKKLLFGFSMFLGLITNAQSYSLTGNNPSYSQDFNSLDTSSTVFSSNLPTGWSILEVGTNSNNQYRGGFGNSTTGDTYSFGSTNNSDRSIGGLASNSLTPHFGIKFTNNTGSTITSLSVSYKGEQWRVGNTAQHVDSLVFLYSTTATNVNDTAATTNWNTVSTLLFQSVQQTATTAGALDGNLAANYATISGSIPVSIPAGSSIVIKWIDKNISGNDDGLAVDDLNINFTTSGSGTVSYNPLATTFTPSNGATNVATTATISATFDRNITANAAGNIYIKNLTDNTSITKSATSSDVTINGKTVTIANAGLLQSKTYAIQIDSAAFDTAGYKYAGIYDTTTWKFKTAVPVNYAPTITTYMPANNSINVAPGSILSFTMSRVVTPGAGSIKIKELTSGTIQTIAANTTNIVNRTVYITNANITFGKSYAIQIDANAFDTAGYTYAGIANDTTWKFTANNQASVTALNETFDNACVPDGWVKYNASGNQEWYCVGTTNKAMMMNGFANSTNNTNEDWLISPSITFPTNTSSAQLIFRSKSDYTGDNYSVWVSNNYTTGNPSTATWTDLGIAHNTTDSGVYVTKLANLPSASIASAVRVAFKYTSSATSGKRVALDSVVTNTTTNIHMLTSNTDDLHVIGIAQQTQVQVLFNAPSENKYQVNIMDMMGRTVYNNETYCNQGANKFSINTDLNNGVYIIRINNNNYQAHSKFIVE
ncbi:MAG: hypothetical protein RIQ61_126 [Bacteroidota bacterium]|jgi:hypothetical protein